MKFIPIAVAVLLAPAPAVAAMFAAWGAAPDSACAGFAAVDRLAGLSRRP